MPRAGLGRVIIKRAGSEFRAGPGHRIFQVGPGRGIFQNSKIKHARRDFFLTRHFYAKIRGAKCRVLAVPGQAGSGRSRVMEF